MLRVRVSTASAEIIETELITAGRRGLECGFEFNSAWDGLAKTVIVNGVVKRDIVLVSDTITVPGECLVREQFPLRIGVYGANGAGEIVIPTIWANFGKILPSARPSGVDPDEVTPDVVAQIQQNSSDALRLAQEVMRRADSGEFDGRDGATGPSGADGRDGQNGNSIWSTTQTPMPASGGVAFTQLTGRSGVAPAVGDIVIRASRYVYQLVEISEGGTVFVARLLGDIKGAQGVADAIWRTTASIAAMYPSGYAVNVSDLVGRSGVSPKAGDLVIGPEPGETGDPTYLYTISRISGSTARLDGVGSIRGEAFTYEDFTAAQLAALTGPQGPVGPTGNPGEDGFSPVVTVTAITGGHRVTITDAQGAHAFDVMDGEGGGSVEEVFWATYNVTTESEVTAAVTAGKAVMMLYHNLSDNSYEVFYLAKQAAIGPSGSAWLFVSANQTSLRVTFVSGSYWNSFSTLTIPSKTSDLTNDSGFITGYTETDPTVPSWAKASSKPSYTAAEVGAVAANQGSANAGKFLVVGSDGAVTPVAMSAWQGGSY